MLALPLALRSLFRDWRNGDLTLLSLALVVAVTSVTTSNNFTGRVQDLLNEQTSQMLGADVVITSKIPIPQSLQNKANDLGLTQMTTLTFPSMVVYKEAMQLAQIKAIPPRYPLRGQLKIAPTLLDDARPVTHPPKEGSVWASANLFALLGINMGDRITIGAENFLVAGVLVDEPGQTGDWFTISPRIMMNHNDVNKTAAIQKGSNLTWSWLLVGRESNLSRLKTSLSTSITEEQWTDSKKNSSIAQTIERTLAYLNIGTLMSLVLAGVAISMASMRYTKRHQQQVALLRCFGASRRVIFLTYLVSMLILGIIASTIGVGLGYALQPLLVHWLRGLLPNVDAQFTFTSALFGFACGMLVLLCFTLVNLLKLCNVSAVSIFRTQQRSWDSGASLSYGLALLLLASFSYGYTRSVPITAAVVLGCIFYVLFAVVMLFVSVAFIKSIKRVMPLTWQFGFTNIGRNFANSTLQIVGIGLALTAILGLILLRSNLLHDWQQQLPKDAPNFFIINIEPTQVKLLTDFLTRNAIKSDVVYPIVKGRLTTLNGEPIQQRLGTKANNINALQRDLNFSWTDQLPPQNTLSAGQWGVGQELDQWVSVEQGLAEQLTLKLGDTLCIRIGNEHFFVKVTSFRKVNWSNFKPNFFILFKPGMLNHLPKTFITSIYLTHEQQKKLPSLAKQFPNMTIIDVAGMINKIQSIVVSAGKAMTFISFFSLCTGFIIATLAMLSFSEIKQQETRVLKVLGMRRRSLLRVRYIESCIIGFYAGLLAILTATYINYHLNSMLFGLPFNLPWMFIFTVPFLTAVTTMLMNTLIARYHYGRRYGPGKS